MTLKESVMNKTSQNIEEKEAYVWERGGMRTMKWVRVTIMIASVASSATN